MTGQFPDAVASA